MRELANGEGLRNSEGNGKVRKKVKTVFGKKRL